MIVSGIDIEKLKNNIIKRSQRHECIYLYGAGRIGRKWKLFLNRLGIYPTGYIISKGNIREFCGLPVINAAEAKENLHHKYCVIGAFLDASDDFLRRMLGNNIDTIVLSNTEFYYLFSKDILTPILEELRNKYSTNKIIDIKNWKNILVIRLDVLGDNIMSTAFLRELKRNCPQGSITLLVRRQLYSLYKNSPYVTHIALYNQDSVDGLSIDTEEDITNAKVKISKFVTSEHKMQENFDVVINLCTLLGGRSGIEAFLLMFASKATCRIGRINSFEILGPMHYRMLNDLFSVISYEVEEKHEVLYMLDMITKCGGKVNSDRIEVWPEPSDVFFAKNVLKYDSHTSKKIIAIGLVGSIPSKNWPVEKYIMAMRGIAKRYFDDDILYVLIGGKDASSAANELIQVNIFNDVNILDLTGKTDLSQCAAILKLCDLYIGADTGVMHMAAAVGVPVVELGINLPDSSIGDGAVPERMGAWGVPTIALSPQKALGNCSRLCTYGAPHCITQITVEEVVEAAEELLHKCESQS